jgi:hypothetical protein
MYKLEWESNESYLEIDIDFTLENKIYIKNDEIFP